MGPFYPIRSRHNTKRWYQPEKGRLTGRGEASRASMHMVRTGQRVYKAEMVSECFTMLVPLNIGSIVRYRYNTQTVGIDLRREGSLDDGETSRASMHTLNT